MTKVEFIIEIAEVSIVWARREFAKQFQCRLFFE